MVRVSPTWKSRNSDGFWIAWKNSGITRGIWAPIMENWLYFIKEVKFGLMLAQVRVRPNWTALWSRHWWCWFQWELASCSLQVSTPCAFPRLLEGGKEMLHSLWQRKAVYRGRSNSSFHSYVATPAGTPTVVSSELMHVANLGVVNLL